MTLEELKNRIETLIENYGKNVQLVMEHGSAVISLSEEDFVYNSKNNSVGIEVEFCKS